MNDNIYELAKNCLDITENVLKIKKNVVLVQGYAFTDFDVEGNKQPLVDAVSALISAISGTYPSIAIELQNHINYYNSGEIIKHHCSIVAILKCMLEIEKPLVQNRKKIFISHSSKDKDIIKDFTNLVLGLGIGISSEDIFCTSIEDMTMKNGEDIRQHIKTNILTADYSFLMISQNYKTSEICLNEMGAVWTANNRVKYYILPNSGFEHIGWLNEVNKAEKLFNPIALDALRKELLEYYNLPDNGITWSTKREEFLSTSSCGSFH